MLLYECAVANSLANAAVAFGLCCVGSVFNYCMCAIALNTNCILVCSGRYYDLKETKDGNSL